MMLRRMTNTGTISVLSGGPAEHGTGGAMTAWDGGGAETVQQSIMDASQLKRESSPASCSRQTPHQ